MTKELFHTGSGRKDEPERIAAIEYRPVKAGWVPFAVTTVRPRHPNWVASYFDVSWSERDQCVYYHESGGGGEGLGLCSFVNAEKEGFERLPLWIDRTLLTPCCAGDATILLSDEDLRARGYEPVPEPLPLLGGSGIHPFEDGEESGGYEASEDDTLYCCICHDQLPTDSLCRHVFWDERWSVWAGPGYEEHDDTDAKKTESFRAPLFRLLDFMPRADVRRLQHGLTTHSFRTYYLAGLLGGVSWKFYVAHEKGGEQAIYCDFLDDLEEEDQEFMAAGFCWLTCLDPGETIEADTLTAQWVNQWLHESGR